MVRLGAVSYLNTQPLVWGLEHGLPGADRIALSYATPSRLVASVREGRLDVALLPVVALAELEQLEIVPGLGIVTHGASGSVLLVTAKPLEQIASLALDPESETSNALAQVLLAWRGGRRPDCRPGPADLGAALAQCDGAVRIGDKALFEPRPAGVAAHDLGTLWTERTGLPFVFAVWAARPGVVDRDLTRLLHASWRAGAQAIERIAEGYRFAGRAHPQIARRYLSENIRFGLGAPELGALERFLQAARRLELIDRLPALRLAAQDEPTGPTPAAVGAADRRGD